MPVELLPNQRLRFREHRLDQPHSDGWRLVSQDSRVDGNLRGLYIAAAEAEAQKQAAQRRQAPASPSRRPVHDPTHGVPEKVNPAQDTRAATREAWGKVPALAPFYCACCLSTLPKRFFQVFVGCGHVCCWGCYA